MKTTLKDQRKSPKKCQVFHFLNNIVNEKQGWTHLDF